MGRAATELLLQLIESKRPVKDFEKRVLTPEFQVRASSVPSANKSSMVNKKQKTRV
jgi:DNA-binding LacI/PurR family transcriptional regulator